MNPLSTPPRYGRALLLFVLTCASTTYVGGIDYSIPLMAILLAHEFGHYIAARLHRVPASLPYFIPLPFGILGTLGAVIVMPGRIARRNALLDIGAAGPLAGLCVAVPVLLYGLSESPVAPISTSAEYLQEGHSLLYELLLWAATGGIPAGHDVQLNATAFAGWVGLLVTMMNLIPAAQLDGGHIAYALFGPRQQRQSRWVRRALLPLGIAIGLMYGVPAYLDGFTGDALLAPFSAGFPWLMWSGILALMVRRQPFEHPPTDDAPLSPIRRRVALGCLILFALLFMPSWLRPVIPNGAP